MVKYLIVVCVACTLVAFQNCSNQSFSSRDSQNKAMSLDGSEQLVEDQTPIEVVQNEGNSSNNNSSVGGSDSSGSTSSSSNGSEQENGHHDVVDNDKDDDHSSVDSDKDHDKNHEQKDEDKEKPRDVAQNEDDKDQGKDKDKEEPKKEESKKDGKHCQSKEDGNARFACILEGNGKSRHVAVINDQIVSDNSTPKTACMSRHACEEIVGSRLRVKSVESRGYCKNGTPQVLVFTDAEMQKLVDKVK